VAYEDATEAGAAGGYEFRDEEAPGRGSLPLRVGLRDEPDDTIDSARLVERVRSLLRSFEELSLLPDILLHMMARLAVGAVTGWTVKLCTRLVQWPSTWVCWVSDGNRSSLRHVVIVYSIAEVKETRTLGSPVAGSIAELLWRVHMHPSWWS
jgi:hypothetical protein